MKLAPNRLTPHPSPLPIEGRGRRPRAASPWKLASIVAQAADSSVTTMNNGPIAQSPKTRRVAHCASLLLIILTACHAPGGRHNAADGSGAFASGHYRNLFVENGH